MVDPLAAEARRLRTVELLASREIRRRLGVGKDRLVALLRDVPPPEWTKRPNAKDELRARAVELRGTGRSVPEIATEPGVAKSTAYRWVGHLPLCRDPEAEAERRREHSRRMSKPRPGGGSRRWGCRRGGSGDPRSNVTSRRRSATTPAGPTGVA